jgi:hypothetical protein
MLVRKLIMAAALMTSASVGLPSVAHADGGDRGWHGDHDDDDDDRGRHYYRHRGHYYDGYAEPRRYSYDRPRYRCRSGGTTGLIIGGAAGALLGREIDRYGDRAPGTIIGAGAGALLGREIARKHRC